MTNFRDILTLAGLAACVYGVYLIHPPCAWIVGGVFAVVVAVAWSIAHHDEHPRQAD